MRTLANFQEIIDVPMIIATYSSDLIVTIRVGPYNVVTQLRDNPSCKSSVLEVHPVQRGDFSGCQLMHPNL